MHLLQRMDPCQPAHTMQVNLGQSVLLLVIKDHINPYFFFFFFPKTESRVSKESDKSVGPMTWWL